MDTELEQGVVERNDAVETVEPDAAEENGGGGAVIAMLIALSSFLLAVVLVLLRHALFGA